MRRLVLLVCIPLSLVLVGLALTHDWDPHSPFAAQRLIAVHVLASLPLAIGITLFLSPAIPRADRRFVLLSGVIWLVLNLFSSTLGRLVGPALDAAGTGFVERVLVRVVWVLVLELPPCIAIWSAMALTPIRPPRLALALATLAAVAPPALFADRLAEQWTRQAEEALADLRLDDARRLLTGLTDLGSTTPVGGHAPSRQLAAVREQWAALEKVVARPLPESAAPAARVERARLLGVLGRLDDAAALAEPLADSDANAAILLAVVRQKQKRFGESSDGYRKSLALFGDAPGTIAGRVQAYDGLAFNAREQRQPAEAEAAYREGMERLPAAAAHFHFQLGRHYQLAGRPVNALEHLHEAVKLDPSRYAEPARPLIADLTRSTPGCFLGRPK